MLVLATCLLPFVLGATTTLSPAQQSAASDEPAVSQAPPSPKSGAEPTGGSSAEQTARADEDAAVKALLLAARRYQRGDRPLPRPSSLHGRFHVTLRQDDGSMIKADVERWYTRDPQRLLTTSTERVTGATSTVSWNEGVAWFRDHKTGDVVVYSDSPDLYEVDLDLLQEQLELTQLLLDASVLDALVSRLVGAHISGTRVITDPDDLEHTVTLVTSRITDPVYARALGAAPVAEGEAPLVLELELAIEPTTGKLWEMRVRSPGRVDLPPMRLRFVLHGHTRSGLRVPGNIKLYRADELLERIALGVGLDEDGYLIFDVDTPIDERQFAAPKPR